MRTTPLVTSIFVLVTAAARAGEPDQVAKKLLNVFREYTTACIKGDLDGFRRLRESGQLRRLDAILEKRGQKLTAEHIRPRNPDSVRSLLSYPIVQTQQKGEFARLALLNNRKEDIREAELKESGVQLFFILFRKENGLWKVVNFGPIVLDKKELPGDFRVPEGQIPPPFQFPE